MPVVISRHALDRWIERVEPTADDEKATASIMAHGKVLELAVSLKAHAVKLGCGAKLVLKGDTIVTVLPKG